MAARTAVLSEGQLATLAEHGEERRAEVGDVLGSVIGATPGAVEATPAADS